MRASRRSTTVDRRTARSPAWSERARGSGRRVRGTAELIDAETDAHLWAERFAGDAGDLFPLQDEITCRIAVALDLELPDAAAARAPAARIRLDHTGVDGKALVTDKRRSHALALHLCERPTGWL